MAEKTKMGAIRMGCCVESSIGLHVRESESEGESRIIEGYAVVFDSPSRVMLDFFKGPLREYVENGAVEEAMLRECDIIMTAFHDREILLARHHPASSGKASSLNVEVREAGVWVWFEAPRSSWGDNVLEAVRRGDMSGMSFSFMDSDYQYIDKKGKDGITERHITKIERIFEMTITNKPAYPATTAEIREAEEEEARIAEEKAKAEAEAAEKKKCEEQQQANIAAIRALRDYVKG